MSKISYADIVARLDTPFDDWFDEDDLMANLNLGYMGWLNLNNHGFQSRPVQRWLCTDTSVGMNLLYHQGEPFAMTYQPFRRADKKFFWFSADHFSRIQRVVLDISNQENKSDIQVLDLNQLIEDHYKLEFTAEFAVVDDVTYQDQPAKIIHDWSDREPIAETVTIEQAGVRSKVPASELKIPIKLRDK